MSCTASALHQTRALGTETSMITVGKGGNTFREVGWYRQRLEVAGALACVNS